MKGVAQVLLFQMLGYRRLVSRLTIASYMDLRIKKEEIRQAEEKVLKRVDG